jgi:putative FmdB family regulatory protein
VPIYEFECEECGTRFETLVATGTDAVLCSECGAERTRRRYSAQSATFRRVKSPGDARRQEAKNAKLKKRTKDAFKARRKRQREARAKAGGSGE